MPPFFSILQNGQHPASWLRMTMTETQSSVNRGISVALDGVNICLSEIEHGPNFHAWKSRNVAFVVNSKIGAVWYGDPLFLRTNLRRQFA